MDFSIAIQITSFPKDFPRETGVDMWYKVESKGSKSNNSINNS